MKNYSLLPDMLGGWKPKKNDKITKRIPFPLRYDSKLAEIIIEVTRKKDNSLGKLIYQGNYFVNKVQENHAL